MNAISNTKRLWSILWLISFLTVALTVALATTNNFHNKGAGWVPSVLLGAYVGVVVSWLIGFVGWRIWMRITRGAPFRVGDRFIVTDGPNRGATGEVRRLCDGRCSIQGTLDRDSPSSDLHFFDWDEIRRIGRRKGVRSH
jgi:hypothetical protein